jgi:serine/threonine protein kinase
MLNGDNTKLSNESILDDQIMLAYDSIDLPLMVVSELNEIIFMNKESIAQFGTHNDFYTLFPSVKLPAKEKTIICTKRRKIPVEISTGRLSSSHRAYNVVTIKPIDVSSPSRYEMEFDEVKVIGVGGFGSVYRSRNKLDGHEYAIKKVYLQCDPDQPPSPMALSVSPTSTVINSNIYGRRFSFSDHRLVREVTTLATVSNHPHIVRYYNAWIESNDGYLEENNGEETYIATLYIQMQLYTCDSLRTWLDSRTEINVDLNLSVFMQLVDAICHIHRQGIIHRDVKPDNIFMEGHQIHLGDFGLAKSITGHLVPILQENTQESTDYGTYIYCPPESTSFYTTKSDIYALGMILFELYCLFGSGMERSIVLSKFKDSRYIPDEMLSQYPMVCELILALTNKDPDGRPTGEMVQHHPIFNRALSAGGAEPDVELELDPFENISKLQNSRTRSLPRNIPRSILSVQDEFSHLQVETSPRSSSPIESKENLGMIQQLEQDVLGLEARLQYLQLRSDYLENELKRKTY